MASKPNLILDRDRINQIIRRIAFEIYENNFNEEKLYIVGLYDRGYSLAEQLFQQVSAIADGVEVHLLCLKIDKNNPLSSEIELDMNISELAGQSIILVDDVLNSGKTLMHALKALLTVDIRKIKTAVLVNRSHKRFPIKANYKGYELSTTIDEHVEVRLEGEAGVYLR